MEKREEFSVVSQMDPDTGEIRNPVVRRVVMTDGKVTMTKSEQIVAQDLVEFRKNYPHHAHSVKGAPSMDQIAFVLKDMSDEELQVLGLSRGGVVQPSIVDLFASKAAFDLATQQGQEFLERLQEMAGDGSGPGGKFRTADLKLLLEDDEDSEDEEPGTVVE